MNLHQIVGIQNEGDGAVILASDLHIGAELPVLRLEAALAAFLQKLLIQGNCGFGTGGSNEARASAVGAVAVERELADDQNLTADIRKRTVHLAVFVLEYAQT